MGSVVPVMAYLFNAEHHSPIRVPTSVRLGQGRFPSLGPMAKRLVRACARLYTPSTWAGLTLAWNFIGIKHDPDYGITSTPAVLLVR